MNPSDFALNLISSKVTESSFTVFCRTFLISISELGEAITISSNGSFILGINLDKLSECGIFSDGRNYFKRVIEQNGFPSW